MLPLGYPITQKSTGQPYIVNRSSVNGQSFVDSIEDCFLTQHVQGPTRGDSKLDLVFTDEPNMIDKVEVMGRIGKSDHNMLLWTADVKVCP